MISYELFGSDCQNHYVFKYRNTLMHIQCTNDALEIKV